MVSNAILDIDRRRRILKLTQSELCKAANLSEQTYTNLINGRGQKTLIALERALEELENVHN